MQSTDVSQLLDYYPYGDLRINDQESGFDEKRKFTGHEHDDDTDLEYANARYYNANIGRFISKDTWEGKLENPRSLNRYSYALNNPIRYTDPSGNCAWDACVLETALVISTADVIAATAIAGLSALALNYSYSTDPIPNVFNSDSADETNMYPNGAPKKGWGKAKAIITGIGVLIGHVASSLLDYKDSVNNDDDTEPDVNNGQDSVDTSQNPTVNPPYKPQKQTEENDGGSSNGGYNSTDSSSDNSAGYNYSYQNSNSTPAIVENNKNNNDDNDQCIIRSPNSSPGSSTP